MIPFRRRRDVHVCFPSGAIFLLVVWARWAPLRPATPHSFPCTLSQTSVSELPLGTIAVITHKSRKGSMSFFHHASGRSPVGHACLLIYVSKWPAFGVPYDYGNSGTVCSRLDLSLACLLAAGQGPDELDPRSRRPPPSMVEESESFGTPWAGLQPNGWYERKSPVAAIPRP